MAISWIWAGMVILSLFCGLYTGNLDDVASAALNGAQSAVELSFSMAGVLCLWSGVMEVLNACGLSQKIAGCFHPLLHRLLPQASQDSSSLAAVSANVSANLLGLGNAATPAGIRAAQGLHRLHSGETASDDMCMLVVINTASLQLIPTTIGAIRASYGAANPFDIIPAVWLASILSLAAGILAAKLMAHGARRRA